MKFPPTISQDYENNLENMCNQFSISSNVNKFFHTPYFKRYFNSKDVTEMVAFYEVQNYIKNIISIDAIWNDIGFDYFQQYHFVIETSVLSHFNNSILKKWMSENLSHRTFLNMLSVYYPKVGYCVYQTNIADTFSQLVSLLDGGYEVSIPNRWRFVEFHDHISYLYLKKDIKNVEHKNEFISIPFTKDKWKVYQPKDTLELAIWGKKVRNCVLSYENKIINKESVIILIEEDDTPKYTFELDYNSPDIVKQKVGIGNSQLTNEETELCTKLIQSVTK
jgi:hypothetical protein